MTENSTARISKEPVEAGSQPYQAADRLHPVEAQALQIPLIGHAVFWRPRHVTTSPLLGQIPFLFWLMETIRPRTVMQIGLSDGVAYMALCQASERLNGSTICFGLYTQAPPLPTAFLEEHNSHYADFSRLIHIDHSNVDLQADACIDFLIISQALDQETLPILENDVLNRLSEDSVILICQPEEVLADAAVRHLLMNTQRHLTLAPVTSDGHAIQLVLHGKAHPDRLRIFTALQPGQPAWLAARQAFNRLGHAIVTEQQNRNLQEGQSELRRALKTSDANLKSFRSEVEEARASEDAQLQRQAELSGRVHDLQERLAEAGEQEARLRDELQSLEKLLREAREKHETSVADIQILSKQLATTQAQHEARIEDIAALTAKFHKDKVAVEAKAAAAKAELRKVTRHRDKLIASTSWKITGPLRKVRELMRS